MARTTIKFKLKPGQCRTIAGRRICNRWQRNTTAAGDYYRKGLRSPRRPWGKCTCEAQGRYKSGVDKAHGRGAFKRGVKRVGSRGFKVRTLLKGPTRFAEGVHGAGNDYAKGFAPYHSHFPSIRMGPRFRRRDPRNINRCAAVCSAYGRLKVGKATAGRITCPET